MQKAVRHIFFFKKAFFVLFASYVSLLAIGGLSIHQTYMAGIRDGLNEVNQRISQEIVYQNGEWDISKYNSDAVLPGKFRVAVFTAEGVVIDRWRPIGGFLDISDFSRLLAYQTPQTVHTITKQDWRMLSQPIADDTNKTLGVVTVSYYNPDLPKLAEIDKKLQQVISSIHQDISIRNGNIYVQNLASNASPYDVSFQVVDQFNHILYKDRNVNSLNQIPDFIDPSYVKQEMSDTSFKQVIDKNSNERVLAKSRTLFDANGVPIGVVVSAASMSPVLSILSFYFLFAGLAVIPISVCAWMLLLSSFAKFLKRSPLKKLGSSEVEAISFSKQSGRLKINSYVLPITYATNQYYMCLALFSYPGKKWENDELLEKFGEQITKDGWRKVYDAMFALNKKVEEYMFEKLIIVDNKTYKINPILLEKVSKTGL